MYFIDFIKSLAKKHRIPVIIYLVLNIFIITYIFNWFATSGSGEFNWTRIISEKLGLSSHEVNKQYKEAIDRLLMAFQYVYQSDASDYAV